MGVLLNTQNDPTGVAPITTAYMHVVGVRHNIAEGSTAVDVVVHRTKAARDAGLDPVDNGSHGVIDRAAVTHQATQDEVDADLVRDPSSTLAVGDVVTDTPATTEHTDRFSDDALKGDGASPVINAYGFLATLDRWAGVRQD